MDYDDEYETVFPLPFWAVLIVSLIVILPGCATVKEKEEVKPTDHVCLMKLMGRTGGGEPIVRMLCVTQEQFAESQK